MLVTVVGFGDGGLGERLGVLVFGGLLLLLWFLVFRFLLFCFVFLWSVLIFLMQ